MKHVNWIERYRSKIFAIELLLAIVFGPAISKSLWPGVWYGIFTTVAFFIILEFLISIFRISLVKAAHAKTNRIYAKTQEAHTQLKKEYTSLSGERLDGHKNQPRKKKRKKKGKKTHRK